MAKEVTDYDLVFKDIMERSYQKLVEDKQQARIVVNEELNKTLQSSAVLMANCFAPMFYKLTRLKERNPNFEPSHILLSQEAYNRLKALQSLKLVPSGRVVMGVPFSVSTRIKKEVYCKYE